MSRLRPRRGPAPGAVLTAARSGATVRVTGIEIEGPVRARLAEFGLRPGAAVMVLGRTAGGGRLLGIGAGRVALDHATAARVGVQPE